ncbi:hypothetical protein NliqN6_5337 [Naganishia liquefaciens]|uniref:Uncharacterized protein n=1 Tax=Naganishia liquefaciens TaxID=104408 RepID=A0A8H3TY19_9TREE|nr:hypothetical protein NliqN6_5337 [Naganishia liquefaciens]
MATGQDERLLSGHAASSRQYGATDHRVSFGADTDQADRRSSVSSSSSTSSSLDDSGLADVTYRYMLYLYLLIPVIIGLIGYSLILLGKYAWPPTAKERALPNPPAYPHPFQWQPFSIGMLASICVQAMRYPIYEGFDIAMIALFGASAKDKALLNRHSGRLSLLTSLLAITALTSFHEALRIFTLYLINPRAYSHDPLYSTTTQIFQQSYHLGLGWGLAEAFWGIAKGWFAGMRLYVDVLPWKRQNLAATRNIVQSSDEYLPSGVSDEAVEERRDGMEMEVDDDDSSAEEDLATKIAILERLQGRRELEQALGIPFPNIAFPLHILWRLDALLFNLGLTLIVSAYYYNIEPIYTRHPHQRSIRHAVEAAARHHRLLPLIIFAVISVHMVVSIAWALGVRRVGIGAVTWGSLIISLGALFAGLGAWGALV